MESIKVPSPKCPICGSERVFVSRSTTYCDECGKPTATTSNFMEQKKNKQLKILLEDIGDYYVDEVVECV